jgi:ribA/ribD-fused uncharacterized protein
MENETHVFFYGHKPNELGVHVFSQFFPCHFTDPKTNKTYSSAEQWMMYHKALFFDDTETAEHIMQLSEPAEIKALGRYVRNFDDKLWDTRKFEFVVQGNYLKFSQNSSFLSRLKATDNKTIVEASH